MIPMILLQPFDINHFDQLIAWETDEEALMQFAGPSFSFPLTKEQLALTLTDKKRLSYSVWYASANKLIGHAEIYFPDASTAFLCRLLIGDTNYRGKGWGLQMVHQLLHIAFAQPGIKEAALNVFDWNAAAIQCYKKAGFTIEEGQSKTRQVNNKTWTTLHMRLSATSWKQLQSTNQTGAVTAQL